MCVVLLVDHKDRTALSRALKARGYEVQPETNSLVALEVLNRRRPKLLLVDCNLGGIELCRRLRINPDTARLPTILLGAGQDCIRALNAGADDFLRHPVSVDELVARMEALQRRTQASVKKITHEDVEILPLQRRVYVGGRLVDLTKTEFELLSQLAAQPGRAWSRDQLLLGSGGPNPAVCARSIDAHVRTLRKKLRRPGLIETVYGVGYRVRESGISKA